jgi:hypothetical protein
MDAQLPWIDREGYSPLVLHLQSSETLTLDIIVSASGSPIASDRLSINANQSLNHTVLLPPFADSDVRLTLLSDQGHSETSSIRPTLEDLESIGYVGSNQFQLAELNTVSSGTCVLLEARDLPHRWQGYSRRQGLILGPESRRLLDDRQRLALRRFTDLGGQVWLLGEAWPELPRARLLKAGDPQAASEAFLELKRQQLKDHGLNPTKIPISDAGGPVLFMLLSVAFFVVAGPLNLWWARRRKQLHLLFISTPVLSGGACLALIVGGLIGEGVSLRRSAIELSDLDPAQQEAFAWWSISYYAPFAPGEVLLADDAQAVIGEVGSYSDTDYGYHNPFENAVAIDWRNGQTLDGRWIPARQQRQLCLTQPVAERRRLILEKGDDGGWWLTNGLGVGIRRLSWRDGDGREWSIMGLPAGARLQFQPQRGSAANMSTELLGSLDPFAAERWQQRGSQTFGFLAQLDTPLHPLPGPTAEDTDPPSAWCCGRLAPEEGQP